MTATAPGAFSFSFFSFWPFVTRLGEAQILLPAALAIAAWLAWRGGAARTAGRWLVAIGAAAALTTATKLAFIGWGAGSAALDFTGVSGHAMFAAATLPVLLRALARPGGRWPPRSAVAAGFALAAVVAVSRVVVDAHSTSEVVAGFALGGAASGAVLAGAGFPPQPAPRWLPLLLAGWLATTPAGAPPSRTHGWVTHWALALSGHAAPYTRVDLHAGRRPAP